MAFSGVFAILSILFILSTNPYSAGTAVSARGRGLFFDGIYRIYWKEQRDRPVAS